jgi:hypothetical protein
MLQYKEPDYIIIHCCGTYPVSIGYLPSVSISLLFLLVSFFEYPCNYFSIYLLTLLILVAFATSTLFLGHENVRIEQVMLLRYDFVRVCTFFCFWF